MQLDDTREKILPDLARSRVFSQHVELDSIHLKGQVLVLFTCPYARARACAFYFRRDGEELARARAFTQLFYTALLNFFTLHLGEVLLLVSRVLN